MLLFKDLVLHGRFALIFLIVITGINSIAQNKGDAPATVNLKVEWQPKQNNYEGKQQSLAELTITNTSKKDLPAKGWTIYFNGGGSFPEPTNNGLRASFVNGDLYMIKPDAGFKGLPPGKSMKYDFITQGSIKNFTGAPRGFYLVWDDNPAVGIPLNESIIAPDASFLQSKSSGRIDWSNPTTVYNKNSTIINVNTDELPRIFPTPRESKSTPGIFPLNSQTSIYADPSFVKEANYLADELGKVLSNKPKIVSQQVSTPAIFLRKDNSLDSGYTLSVLPNEIVITATTGQGIFYGIQSLKILLPPLSWKAKQQSISVPGVDVKDEPRFGYRSFMLDVARNFQPKEEILKILDLMSLYKLNVFHLHFSEDEGWRIEIPSLPELTTVGSQRGHTLDNKTHLQPSFGSGGATNKLPGSGFYSRTDFIDILKYATDRYIQIIPEVESPGHARAAIKSMEARYAKLMQQNKPDEAQRYLLTDIDDTSKYRSVQGWNDNVMNVALPSVYQFMEKVTDELIAMYKEAGAPLTTIHFGGDEVPSGVWEGSPAYQKLKTANPEIKTADDLWYYYYGKLNDMLKNKGLFMSGWEEMGMRKTKLDGKPYYIPNPDFADDHFQLHVWNNVIGSGAEDLAYRLANAGYKVVLSNVSNQYFDLAYNSSFNEPGFNWGGYVDVDKPYYSIPFDFLKNVKEDGQGNPIDKLELCDKMRLTDYGKGNIVGIQGLLWSENNINTSRLEYMMLPKLLGLAERAWSQDPAWAIAKDSAKANQLYYQAWSQFVNSLGKRELPRLSYYHGGFNYRIPPPGIKNENGMIVANNQFPGLELRYTTNGKDPDISSAKYTQPINTKGRIRMAAFDVNGRRGQVSELENKL